MSVSLFIKKSRHHCPHLTVMEEDQSTDSNTYSRLRYLPTVCSSKTRHILKKEHIIFEYQEKIIKQTRKKMTLNFSIPYNPNPCMALNFLHPHTHIVHIHTAICTHKELGSRKAHTSAVITIRIRIGKTLIGPVKSSGNLSSTCS